ncbi:MAG TPA: DUF1761 domain-containing protein [Chitinophagales bacterium]
MFKLNFLVAAIAALVPIIMGFIWYNPKTLGSIWAKEGKLNPDELKKDFNAPLVFGLTYLFSFFTAIGLNFVVIHQSHLASIVMNQLQAGDVDVRQTVETFMAQHGHNFRTFKHGVLHGTTFSVLFVLPIVGINALFERKSWKYIWINFGFWAISFAIMGGIICQFA